MKTLVVIVLTLFTGLVAFALQEKDKPKSPFQDKYDYHIALGNLAVKIRERVSKSTVAIFVERSDDPEGEGPEGKSEIKGDYTRRPKGPCTGVIIEPNGFIITSRFNVSPTIKKITVQTHKGKKYDAEVLGNDEGLDIALLKIKAKNLPVLKWKMEKDINFGDLVFLLGRAPDPASPTITFGIISAKNRIGNRAYGIDAELNYGNTGGPVVSIEGKLIGIGCNIKPKTRWGQSSGIGFAAKVAEIEKLLKKLKKGDRFKKEKVIWFGIVPDEDYKNGVKIKDVMPGSPVDDADLKHGDVITHFDGKKVKTFKELDKLLDDKEIGDTIKVKFKRKVDGKWQEMEKELILTEKP